MTTPPLQITFEGVMGALARHAATCEHPREFCLTCQAHTVMEGRAGELDEVRFAHDATRSRLAMLYAAVMQMLPVTVESAQRLIAAEGISPTELPQLPLYPPLTPITQAAHHAPAGQHARPTPSSPDTTDDGESDVGEQTLVDVGRDVGRSAGVGVHLRIVQDMLEAAHEVLYRVRSEHNRHAARAIVCKDTQEGRWANSVALILASAWHGPGWHGDPLASLSVQRLRPTQPAAGAEE